MPKVGMETIRRHQLISATIKTVSDVGLADATVIRIARHAEASAGIISHYFGGKDGLLEATMRHIISDLSKAVATQRTALHNATPQTRLAAVIDGYFDRNQASSSITKAWLAFWAGSMHSPQLQRLQHINDRRLHSNLCHEFRQLMPQDAAREAARSLTATMDGLRLRAALTARDLSDNHSRRIAHAHLARLINMQ